MSDFGGGELIAFAVETWVITIISLLPAGFPSARAFIQSKMHWSLTGHFKQWKGVGQGVVTILFGMRSFWRKEDMIRLSTDSSWYKWETKGFQGQRFIRLPYIFTAQLFILGRILTRSCTACPPLSAPSFLSAVPFKKKKKKKESKLTSGNWAPGPLPLPSWAPPLQSHCSPQPAPVPLSTPGVPSIF